MAFLVTRTKYSCICLCVSCCMETAHPTTVGPRQLRGCQCPAALVWIRLLMFHAWASGLCGSYGKASLGLSVARSKYWFRKSRLLRLIFLFLFFSSSWLYKYLPNAALHVWTLVKAGCVKTASHRQGPWAFLDTDPSQRPKICRITKAMRYADSK